MIEITKQHHVHFGPGKLGLGLVVPLFRESCGIQLGTTVVAPAPSQEKPYYKALRDKHEYRLTVDGMSPHTIADVDVLFSSDGTDHQRLVELLSDPGTAIVTTSVGSGLPGLAPVLAEASMARKSETPLFVVACENPPHSSITLQKLVYDQLKVQLGEKAAEESIRGLAFMPSVVDRVCCDDPKVESGIVVATGIEEYTEFVLLDSELNARTKEMFSNLFTFDSGKVRLVNSVPHYEFFRNRKAYLVNGTHLSLGLFAYPDIDTLQQALGRKEILHKVKYIQAGFVYALVLQGLGLKPGLAEATENSLNAYASNVIKRISGGPRDFSTRTVLEWLEWDGKPESFQVFMQKVLHRIVEPTKGYAVAADNSRHIPYALLELMTRMIEFLAKVPTIGPKK